MTMPGGLLLHVAPYSDADEQNKANLQPGHPTILPVFMPKCSVRVEC